MKSIMRILIKDIHEFYYRPYLLAWLLLLPLLFLVLVGELEQSRKQVRLVFDPTNSPSEDRDLARRLIHEYSIIDLVEIKDTAAFDDEQIVDDPVTVLNRAAADLVLQWRDGWHLYLRGSDIETQARLVDIAVLLGWSFSSGRPWQLNEVEQALERTTEERQSQLNMHMLEGIMYRSDRQLIPQVIALVSLFIPFVVASAALVRERELGTLPVLLATPGVSMARLFVGKAILPVVLGVLVLLSCLLFAGQWFGLPIRAGLLPMLALQIAGIVSSTLLGLVLTTRINSQIQAHLGAALYFLCLILFTGFIAPVDSDRNLVWMISRLLPLTFTQEGLTDWLLAGRETAIYGIELPALVLQMLVFGLLALWGFRRVQSRL